MTTTVHDVIEAFDAAATNSARGTKFEELMVDWFRLDPTLSSRYTDVSRWTDWAHRDGSADVGPTKGNHLKRAAQEDSLRGVTGHKANERACDQRLVELPLVEDALHACQEGNNNHEQD